MVAHKVSKFLFNHCACASMKASGDMCVKVRGQLCDVTSLFLPLHELWSLNSKSPEFPGKVISLACIRVLFVCLFVFSLKSQFVGIPMCLKRKPIKDSSKGRNE